MVPKDDERLMLREKWRIFPGSNCLEIRTVTETEISMLVATVYSAKVAEDIVGYHNNGIDFMKQVLDGMKAMGQIK